MDQPHKPSVVAGYGTLARHSSHYFLAQLAIVAAGFISLPILTRVLTKEDFGQLSLILLSVSFLAPCGRIGIPQSITRHFAEYARAGRDSARSYASSMLLTSAVVSVGLVGLSWLVGKDIERRHWGGPWNYAMLIGPLLATEVVLSVLTELYRAQLRSGMAAALSVVSRYATLAGSLLFFFCLSSTFFSFLAGRAVAQGVIVVAFLVPLGLAGLVRLQRIDTSVVREGIRYGFPLSLAASGGFFVAYGDRYVIQTLLNSAQVATYSVPYDLLQQLEAALTAPIRLAIIPIVFSMISHEGVEKASMYLSDVLRGMILLIVPMIFGISFLGHDVIVLLASEKYADSSALLPILSTGILLGGISFILSVGLSYQKRTALIAYMTVGSGILNVGLNALMIPIFGLMGSAWATLITYVLYVVVSYRLSRRYLPLRFYAGSTVCAVVASLCMVGVLWVARPLMSNVLPIAVGLQLILGTSVYGFAVFLLEPNVRKYVGDLLRRREIVARVAA
jgi:O-antigen/teichoic acid export membrane protein